MVGLAFHKTHMTLKDKTIDLLRAQLRAEQKEVEILRHSIKACESALEESEQECNRNNLIIDKLIGY